MFLFVCCFFSIVGFSMASHAAQVSEVEIPDDQPDPDVSCFNMPDGEVMVDDSAFTDGSIIDESSQDSYMKDYSFQKSSIPVPDTALLNLHGREGLQTLAFYIQQNFNHKRGAATTSQGVIETGYGDCWGLSDFALKVLLKNGYTVKLVQGRTSQSNAHRWLEVQLDDGSWTIFDPSLVTKKYHYKPYWYRCAEKTAVIGVYYP
jgi:hypothetical protein